MPAFPTIPEISAGQVASASIVNIYNEGLRWLLGYSHRTFAATYASRDGVSRYQESYGTLYSFYARYQGEATFAYRFEAYQDSGNGTKHCYVKFQYYGDDSAWHDVVEVDSTAISWTHYSSTASLSGAEMTAGKVYEWRMQRRVETGEGGNYNVWVRLWYAALRDAVSGWSSPPTFSAATSAAADMGTVRDDMQALYDALPKSDVLMGCHTARTEDDSGTHTFTKAVYRYRPESLYLAIRAVSWTGWTWTVTIEDTSGNEATIYTANVGGNGSYRWDTASVDLTAGTAATNIAAAGITLTVGNEYLIRHQFTDGGTYVTVATAFVLRVSDQTPAGAWAALNEWSHGDTDFGPTHLNKMSTDLTELYTGGDEELSLDTPLTLSPADAYAGVRLRRYLHYRCSGDDGPVIHYGSSYGDNLEIEGGAGWHVYDLSSISGLAEGQYFWVSSAQSAFQSDDNSLTVVEE